MRTPKILLALTFTALSGCMLDTDPGGADGSVQALQAALKTNEDNGTALTATSHAGEPACLDDDTAVVPISGVLTSTGSVDSAIISVTVDGLAIASPGTIQPQDFGKGGRVKLADYAFDVTLAGGEHTVLVCFTQSGAQGRLPKTTCASVLTVEVDCGDTEQNACQDEGVFGDLVGNPKLCSGGAPHVPVHLRGEFGESVTLYISGPDEFVLQARMRHAGESCIYQYNWDTRGGNHGGPGSYTFRFVNENGKVYSFTRTLACD